MRVLFTGASSFTGYWFVQELARAGHEITAAFRRRADEYADIRAARVARLAGLCRCAFGSSFGDEAFLRLIHEGQPWNVLCHHAADVANYKSDDFDPLAALGHGHAHAGVCGQGERRI